MFIPTFDNSISIHAPTRGATRLISEGHSGYIYFNPRSHKGSDRIRRDLAVGKKISIHAPTRGATHGGGQGCWAEAISIHAPTRGATTMDCIKCQQKNTFQSTLPQGERQKNHKSGRRFLPISIHAPTRGATLGMPTVYYICYNFNPRSHKGSDRDRGGIAAVHDISIHAPTRGATISMMAFRASMRNFNPRSHKGSDRDRGGIAAVHDISIHAPTRGATAKSQVTARTMENFNPRSHKGSDLFSCFERVDYTYFNPRSHKGSDCMDPK